MIVMNDGKATERSVRRVIENGLCTGCGFCVGVCPVSAIELAADDSRASVRDEVCTECALCLKVCPGKGYDVDPSDAAVWPPDLPQVGQHLGIFGVHAVDDETRRHGAAGGTVTAIARFLLSTNQVDKVLVVQNGTGLGSFYPFAGFIDTLDGLTAGQQSKYMMAPYAQVVRDLLSDAGKFRFLFIGLPCQVAALRNLVKIKPQIANSLVGAIGLFCGYVFEQSSVEILLAALRVNLSEVSEFLGWRYGEHPGRFGVRLKTGEIKTLELKTYYDHVMAFSTRLRCHQCPDGLSRLADLSIGDWLTAGKNLMPRNLVICRNRLGLNLLRKAEAAGFILADAVTEREEISRTVLPFMVDAKTLKPRGLVNLLARLQWVTPRYNGFGESIGPDRRAYAALWFFFWAKWVRRRPISVLYRRSRRIARRIGHEIYRNHGRRPYILLSKMLFLLMRLLGGRPGVVAAGESDSGHR